MNHSRTVSLPGSPACPANFDRPIRCARIGTTNVQPLTYRLDPSCFLLKVQTLWMATHYCFVSLLRHGVDGNDLDQAGIAEGEANAAKTTMIETEAVVDAQPATKKEEEQKA